MLLIEKLLWLKVRTPTN